MQNVIQQNAAAAEEMAATSEGLSAQAEQMLGTINFFQVGERAETHAVWVQAKSARVTASPRSKGVRELKHDLQRVSPNGAGKPGGIALALKDGADTSDDELSRY